MSASRVVDRALAEAGLHRFLARRLSGDVVEEDRRLLEAKIDTLDALVVGALADRVRVADRGAVVRIHLRRPADDVAPLPSFDPIEGGIAFLRRVARARLLGAPRAIVRIDVDDVGMQLAQVCLAYGADELVAPHDRRSLTTADGDAFAQAILRERELAALVRAAGREPRIVEIEGGVTRERSVDDHSAVKKKFRAPGRDRDITPEGDPS
jgi:hypothetical protein